ncbi:MAG: S-layer homology domain-containing protein [Patescibacteria group bacterium]
MRRHTLLPLGLSLILALCLAFGQAALAADLSDAPSENHWVYDYYQQLNDAGLIEGYPDGTFKGEHHATRYEVVAFIARLLQYFEEKCGALTEDEVKELISATIEVKCVSSGQFKAVVDGIYAAIQKLEKEFRADLDALGVRVTTLEAEVQSLKAKDTQQDTAIARAQADLEQAQKDAKKARCLGILGILLALLGWVF